ncbi:LysR family transcriptional regulator [Solilutibacter silvestris]|uniref:Transcriptional regulator n=1 Tax=Solilutibacter silvestris TaxID=1645665 RepID=A0A2K1Q098_9GAMM|nr:LysR family transcriptional regulator [Lysobacter silvestris]PNS08462.1 Transcriptional regulator [Lysobacter silvestris]
MDKIREMASFIAVVDAGSFVGAADATGLSKAAISRHVAELEQRLGVRLLNRTTRRLSLTDDGQRFHARAKELLATLDEFESEITSHTGDPSGLLRINAPLTFGVLHLAPLWGRFSALYPKVALDVNLNDRVVDLIEDGFDLAIRITNMPSSQLVSRKLASTRIVLCASPGYLRTHGTPTRPSELARHRVIGYSYWSGRDEWSFTAPDGGSVRVTTTPWLRTNNGDTCRAAALEGQGIILQPDFIVGGDLHRGDLVELMPDYHSIETGIHVVYPTRKHLPMKMRRLIDFLVDAFQDPIWNRC